MAGEYLKYTVLCEHCEISRTWLFKYTMYLFSHRICLPMLLFREFPSTFRIKSPYISKQHIKIAVNENKEVFEIACMKSGQYANTILLYHSLYV